MSERYTIEQAEAAHLQAIPKLEQAAATLFAADDLPSELRYRVTPAAVLRKAQQEERLWVALDDLRRPVGFALAEFADGQAYLAEVDVHPDHARRGLGTRLVTTVARWAEAREADNLLLMTFRHLPWNAPFYEKLGFVPLEEHEFGPELRQFVAEERQSGIDTEKRIAMRLGLPGSTDREPE
jgi:GNAT superfamily N-acetyltransferase